MSAAGRAEPPPAHTARCPGGRRGNRRLAVPAVVHRRRRIHPHDRHGTSPADRRRRRAGDYTVGETHTAGRPKRDPWSFGTPPLPEPSAAPPPSRAPEPESAAPEPPVPTPPRQAPPPRPVGPPLPQVDVIYLGSFGHRGNPIAVFKDTLEDGPKIYNALAGDRIKDKFEVHNIGYESVRPSVR